jgi:hypothetical protein
MCEKCHKVGHEARNCRDRETCSRAALSNQGGHVLGCVKEKQGGALVLMGSDEITSERMTESMGTAIEKELGHYEVYIVNPQLNEGPGVALTDMGSVISLVKESTVVRLKNQSEQINVQGITGAQVKIRGQIDLKIVIHSNL